MTSLQKPNPPAPAVDPTPEPANPEHIALIWMPEKDLGNHVNVEPIAQFEFSVCHPFSGNGPKGDAVTYYRWSSVSLRPGANLDVPYATWQNAKSQILVARRLRNGSLIEVMPSIAPDTRALGTSAAYAEPDALMLIQHVWDAEMLQLWKEVDSRTQIFTAIRDRISFLTSYTSSIPA